jgi:hypothetical protein
MTFDRRHQRPRTTIKTTHVYDVENAFRVAFVHFQHFFLHLVHQVGYHFPDVGTVGHVDGVRVAHDQIERPRIQHRVDPETLSQLY